MSTNETQNQTEKQTTTEQETITEQPKPTPPTTVPENELPEWARNELTKANNEAAARRIELKKYKETVQQTMITKEEHEKILNEKNNEIALKAQQLAQQQIAQQHSLPPELIPYLTGSQEEMTKTAQTFANLIKKPPTTPSIPNRSDTAKHNGMTPTDLAALAVPRRG